MYGKTQGLLILFGEMLWTGHDAFCDSPKSDKKLDIKESHRKSEEEVKGLLLNPVILEENFLGLKFPLDNEIWY